MKVYIVMLIQFMIWSGYTFLEWLSKHDQFIFNMLMFIVFFYLAVTAGNSIIRSTKKTFIITLLSLSLYSSCHFTLALILS